MGLNSDINFNFIVDPEQAVLAGLQKKVDQEDNDDEKARANAPAPSNQPPVVATNTDLSDAQTNKKLRRLGRRHHHGLNVEL